MNNTHTKTKILSFFIVFLIVASSFVLFSETSATGDNWLVGWSNRKSLVIGNATGAGADYQVHLNVTYNSNMLSNFDDLRFTSSDGSTLLGAWLQNKVDSNYANIWVKITDNLNVSSATIYMYYRNLTAVSNIWNQTAVFVDVVSGVVGAWNMEEALATDPVIDYSGNGNNGTATGTTIVPSPFYAGKNARQLINTNYINVPNSASLQNLSAITYIVFSKQITSPTDPIVDHLINKPSNQQYDIYFSNPDNAGIYVVSAIIKNSTGTRVYITISSGASLMNVSNSYGVTANGSIGKTYFNGTYKNQATVSGLTNSTDALRFGASATHIIGFAVMINTALTDAQMASFNLTNYPDVSLLAGSVLVRKYVYPEPAATTWGTEEASSHTYNISETASVSSSIGVIKQVIYAPMLLVAFASDSSQSLNHFLYSFSGTSGVARVGDFHFFSTVGGYPLTLENDYWVLGVAFGIMAIVLAVTMPIVMKRRKDGE